MADSRRWVELAVPAGVEAVEAVSEILDRVGFGGVAIEEPVDGRGEAVVKAYVVEAAGVAGRIEKVRTALGHLQAFGLGPIGELRTRAIEDEDWLESWKASFVPMRIGAFRIRPSWIAEAPAGGPRERAGGASERGAQEDAVTIVLDPGMAFGTGLHPTTRQCLAWLSDADLVGRSLLDVGCGSGVLAIAAAKRGARPVLAVDSDPLAIEATAENALANAVHVHAVHGSAERAEGRFDVVLANIVAPVLRAIAGPLVARLASGGTLVLAGIVASAERETDEAFAALGLRRVERSQDADWVCLVYR